MGYFEAIRDKVRIDDGFGTNKMTIFYPKCQYCKEEVRTFSYSSNKKYTCESCKEKNQFSKKIEREEAIYEKKRKS